MLRDYISHELQSMQTLIEELRAYEQTNEKQDAVRKRKAIVAKTSSPSGIFHYLSSTEADAIAFRTEWQNTPSKNPVPQETIKYYQEHVEVPNIDVASLPLYSFALQFTFTLSQPYISRDEQDFYVIDNPVRKEKIFGLPYVASTSWKGSLRSALWKQGYTAKDPYIRHLFGNDKETKKQEEFNSGSLHFFSTFFPRKSFEVINPHSRRSRAGDKPIAFECVPSGKDSTGTFTLLYVPFDLIGVDSKETRKQVAEELQLIATGLQSMFHLYGFGAKTSSGFGKIQEPVSKGTLKLRATGLEDKKAPDTIQAQPPSPSLPRYLETPQRLRGEYLTSEGTFRERTEAELKKMNKGDKQIYDKAKSWWERVGKQMAEDAKQPQITDLSSQEPPPQEKIPFSTWDFSTLEQLLAIVKNDIANRLTSGEA